MPSSAHPGKASRPAKKPAASVKLREKLGLSRALLARLLKVSENTIFRWDIGKVRPDPISKEKLEQLEKLCELLQPVKPAADIAAWLEQPQNELENFRPIDLIDSEFGRRRLHQVVERMGKIKQMPLPARRAIADYQEKRYPKLLQEIQKAAGFELPIEVHWEELAHYGREPEEFAESFDKGLFQPLIGAFKAITKDALGRKALQNGLHKVVIAENTHRAMNTYEFEEGILRISKNPMVFYTEIQRHTEELRKLLESKI